MYATRLLSDLQKNPELLAARPDGPNSGYLVIQDEESKKVQSCLSWSNKSKFLQKLPFPQDKEVLVQYKNDREYLCHDPVFFIPVLNRPLSHDCYYAIVPHGQHKGKALTSSREEDAGVFKFCCFVCHEKEIEDVSPTPLDPKNRYQQFLIIGSYTFEAVTLARGGIKPLCLRGRENWGISFKNPDNNLKLDPTAQGLDPTLRARLPDFKFPLSYKPFVVGKWYSPFAFVEEGTVSEKRKEVVEGMRWEQKRGGWVKEYKIDFVDECSEEGGDWSEFGRYVLVESFNFRRMDRSLVMSFDFKHFDQMRTHCE